MVDIQTLQTISIAIASAGVFAAAVYYILQIRHQTRIRQTDLVMRLYSAFTSEEFVKAGMIVGYLEYKDYNDFVERYGSPSADKPVWVAINMVGNFFNEVGILLHRKVIHIEFVDELIGYRVAFFWEKLKPLMEGWRKQINPQLARWFEYLYNEMKKREQRGVQNG